MSGNHSYPPADDAGRPAATPTWSPDPVAPAPSAAAQQWVGPTPPGGWGGDQPRNDQPTPYGMPPAAAPAYAPPAYAPPTYAPPAQSAQPYAPPAFGSGTYSTGAPAGSAYGTGWPAASPYGTGWPTGSPLGQNATSGPVYTAVPVGAPRYAPVPVKAPTNGWAIGSFVASLVMLVFGLFSGFYIGSFFVVWMATAGLRRAKAFEAAGYEPRGRALAWTGAVVGILNLVVVLILRAKQL